MQSGKTISCVVPERHGKRWETDEDEYILKRVKEGALPSTIAYEVKRTVNSVISELKKIAYDQIKAGESIDIVVQRTGLTSDIINEYIKNKEIADAMKAVPKNPKPVETRPFFLNKSEESVIDVLKDIRDILRQIVDKK
jgi:hypothetical protein